MADVYETVKEEVRQTVEHYKHLAVDGLSPVEVWELTVRTVATLIRLVEAVSGATDEEKRSAVLHGATLFFDAVIEPLDIPAVPNVLEKTVVDPLLKKVWLNAVEGIAEGLFKVLKKHTVTSVGVGSVAMY